MKKIIGSVIICTALLTIATITFGKTGIINTDTARLRKEASATSTIIDLLSIKDKVEIIEESGDWYKVKAGNQTGYVNKSLIEVEGETKKEENKTEESTEKKEEEKTTTEEEKTQETKEETVTQPESSVRIVEAFKGKLSSEVTIKILPSINSSNIGKIDKDIEFTITEVINDWCHVETATLSGWARIVVVEKSIATEENTAANENAESKEEEKQETATKKGYVNVESVNVRAEKSTSSEKIDSLTKNTEVLILAEEDGWYKVKVNNKTGYISKRYISNKKVEEVTSRASDTARQIAETEPTPAPAITGNKGTDVVAFAKQYLGSRYVYGGASPSTGFDCSGFTSYVYSNFGVSLSRSSSGQASNGTSISKSQLEPGDLLIFNNRSNTSVGHVGIYIGNNQFIHAANPGTGVVTDSLSSSYYAQRYVDAKRVLD